MIIAYFDCFAGISGDMTLGALLDAGADEAEFRHEIGKLSHLGFDLEVSKVVKGGVRATDVKVIAPETHEHRRLGDVRGQISASDLSDSVKSRAVEVFVRLAEAESAVHGVPPEEVQFHEVGAVDAIVDIVGACIGIELLGIDQVRASPLPMGRGFVDTAHGRIPLPAPATVELLKDVPIHPADVEGELVTPTGAAIIRTLAADFGDIPPMVLHSVGYGAGKADFNFPNVLRVMIGQAEELDLPANQVSVVETNIDDMNPELYESAIEKLFEAGALDVYMTPIYMKKSRPATLLSVICPIDRTDEIAGAVLAQTTSFGVRISSAARQCLERQWESVSTTYGNIRVKVGSLKGGHTTASPEYEDCKKAADEHGVPVLTVYDEALSRYHAKVSERSPDG